MFGLDQARAKWWAKREADLKALYAHDEQALVHQLEIGKAKLEEDQARLAKLQKDVADLELRTKDRREDLARSNQELREQIRMVEAKARPDQLWAQAFTAGFLKAWDFMVPLMTKGLEKTHEKLYEQAVKANQKTLEPLILERFKQARQSKLKPVNELLAKKREFYTKYQETKDPRFTYYMTALDWALNASQNGTNTQSSSKR